ncbi:MAG: gluconokinase [Tabrizicola sp.]|jgi:gluconokinase|nr:gluconokinase [Tabrizicola sp.]
MTRRIVIMGVSGCGKSTVGAALSDALGIPYREGDDLHPPANIAKMRAGETLTDADRWPWLDLVAQDLAAQAPVILGCSALRRAYRDRIREGAGGPVCFVHLAGSPALIATRMAARSGHFMPASLLDSQFASLEPPEPDEEAITVDIDQPLDRLVEDILRQMRPRNAT